MPLPVSARLQDYPAQRTALLMKSALCAELDDQAGVREAEGMTAQLVRGREEMLNAK